MSVCADFEMASVVCSLACVLLCLCESCGFQMEQFFARICLCVSCNVFVGFLEGVIIPSDYLIFQSILFPEAKNTGYVSHMCQDVAAPR